MNADALTALVQTFQQHGAGWAAALLPYALTLFAALAGIQFTLRIGFAVAQRVDLPELLALVIQEIITIGFFYWFLENAATFLTAIIDSFRLIANNVSAATGGARNMSPVDVFSAGVDMARTVWQGITWREPGLSILLAFAGLVCVAVFALICAQMVEVLIEVVFVSYGGVLMMAFGGASYTRQYAIAQIRYAISVGAKLFVMQMLLGIAQAIIAGWAQSISAGQAVTDWATVAVMIGVPIVVWRLVQKLPQMAQDMVNGSISQTHGGLLRTAAGFGAAAVGAVASATGAGAAGVAAIQLARRELEASASSTGSRPSAVTQAAMIGGRAAGNLAQSAATDVGRRLTGQYSASHGYRGWRMASDMNRQSRP